MQMQLKWTPEHEVFLQTLPAIVSKWGLGNSQTLLYFLTSSIQAPRQGVIPAVVDRQEDTKD